MQITDIPTSPPTQARCVKSTADDLNAETILATGALALPDGVSVSRTALVCPGELSLDEWKSLGRALTQMETSIQWWIGDWWHYGRHRYGERKAMMTAKKLDDYAFGTLMNYGYVAGRIETSRRREVLSWSHHYEVAKLEPEQQERWLQIAVEQKMSINKLRRTMLEEELSNFLPFTNDEIWHDCVKRLAEAAEWPDRLLFAPPWEWGDGFEDFVLRYFLPAEFAKIDEHFDKTIIRWSKTRERFRQIESKSKTLTDDELKAIPDRIAELSRRLQRRSGFDPERFESTAASSEFTTQHSHRETEPMQLQLKQSGLAPG